MKDLKMPSMDSVARFQAALDSERGAFGPFMITSDPAFVETAGYAGFDFVLLDMEHGPGTFENLQNLIRAANVAGVCPVVRVPRGTDIWIDQALDVGAGVVMIPQMTRRNRHARPSPLRSFPRTARAALAVWCAPPATVRTLGRSTFQKRRKRP